jgi:hypothetical protein
VGVEGSTLVVSIAGEEGQRRYITARNSLIILSGRVGAYQRGMPPCELGNLIQFSKALVDHKSDYLFGRQRTGKERLVLSTLL